MPNNLIKIKKYQGTYYLESKLRQHQGRPDKCFYAIYKNRAKKVVRERVGWASDGYTAAMTHHVRGERLRKIRHGKELPDRKKVELTFGDAWAKYDVWLETGKKHVYDDRNRYQNYVKPRFDVEVACFKQLIKGLAALTPNRERQQRLHHINLVEAHRSPRSLGSTR